MIVEGPLTAEALGDHRFDVCIVGAGAAGITIAKELDHSGLSVVLLEAGGLEVSTESQDLYKGEEDTERMPENYLSSQRLRAFGGTTGHWAGEGRPLDEVDFEAREWIPHSGWPITRRDLSSYYDRASAFCGLPGLQARDRTTPPEAVTDEGMFSFQPLYSANPVRRFGEEYRDSLRASTNVRVFLQCPVVSISASAGSHSVSTVTVASGGQRFDVRARTFVLTAGTVENARVLLNAHQLGTLRLGKEADAVGRYFMDHGEGTCAVLRLPTQESERLSGLLTSFDATTKTRYSPTLWASPRLQARERLPNLAFELARLRVDEEPNQLEGVGTLVDYFRGHAKVTGVSFSVSFRAEARPNPENRVSLTESRDSLGVPRVRLRYRWNVDDLQAVDKALELLARDLGLRHGVVVRQTTTPANVVGSSYHQMGTTRMGMNPTDSVVDRNCQVHSVPNLFVAGSSVFATCGWVNPTLSLVALAIRLADHLKEAS